LAPEVVTTFPTWLSNLPKKLEEIITPDFSPFRGAFAIDGVRIIEQRALASSIARIAAITPAQNPALLDANYVRRSDAELFWTDK
ncbi:MAG TPA: hypothetical protein VEX68_15280, partial [Bryobacteraceae bacterium]|nr:hypothetical protein [Bryobacteraceae bacterium]